MNKNRNERNSFNFTEFNSKPTDESMTERSAYYETSNKKTVNMETGERLHRKKSVGAVVGVRNQ